MMASVELLCERTVSTSGDVSLFVEERPGTGWINQAKSFADYLEQWLGRGFSTLAEPYYLVVLQRLLSDVSYYCGSASATMATSMLDYLTQAGETFATSLVEVEGRLARVKESLASVEGQLVVLEDLEHSHLPRLPLSVQAVKAKIRIGGAGKPAFKTTTEISLYD